MLHRNMAENKLFHSNLTVRRGLRHPARLLAFQPPKAEHNGSNDHSLDASSLHPSQSVSLKTTLSSKQKTSTLLLAQQGYLGNATLLQLKSSASGVRSVYATRTCASCCSFSTLYQLALALWISFSFLGWSIIAMTLLFVVVYGVFNNTETDVPSADTATEAGFVRARAVALLAALVPLLMYLLSLIAYHIFLVEDALLSLAHSAEVLEFALQRGLGCTTRRLPQTRVSCLMRVGSWVLLTAVVALFAALFVASAWGSDTVGAVFAFEVIAMMACIACFHVFSLVWAPLLRYCRVEGSSDAQGEPLPPATWGRWCRVMGTRCTTVRSELWYRAGLVSANAIVGCISCHCLCFASGDDMTEQSTHLQRDLLTWHGVGDCEDQDEHMDDNQEQQRTASWAYTAAAPQGRPTASAGGAASRVRGTPAGGQCSGAEELDNMAGETSLDQPAPSMQPLERQKSSLSGRRAACCACGTYQHHGLWAPASFGSAHSPETVCCGCFGDMRGAPYLVNSAIAITVFWAILGPVFAFVAENKPSAGALVGAISASVYMWLAYAAVMTALLFVSRDGDACFAPQGLCGVCSGARQRSGEACRLSPQRTEVAWHALLSYRITVLALLVGLLLLSAGLPADGEDRPASTSGGLIAAVVVLLLLPLFNALFMGWQLGVRCCSVLCPHCCTRPCRSQGLLVDAQGRIQDVRCRVCEPRSRRPAVKGVQTDPTSTSEGSGGVSGAPAQEEQSIGLCYAASAPCGHVCCCAQRCCSGCRSKWSWYSGLTLGALLLLLLFTISVYSALPAMWVSIWVATLVYCALLANAIPTHGQSLQLLEQVGLKQQEPASSLPPLGHAPAAAAPTEQGGGWVQDAAPPAADEADAKQTAAPATASSMGPVAKEESLQPAQHTGAPQGGGAGSPRADGTVPTSSLTSLRNLSLMQRVIRAMSSSGESGAWAPEDSKPFVSQLVPAFVQSGDADDNTYHYRGHIAEDKQAYAAYAVEQSREVEAARGALLGRHHGHRDPLQVVAYTERHLRMKLVVPCMVLALVTALVLIILVDAGVEEEGGALRGWYDVQTPVLPLAEQTQPPLGVCNFDAAGLGILDYGMLSKAIYLGANRRFYLEGVQQFIPGAQLHLQRLSDEVLNQPVFSVLTVNRPGGLSPAHVLAQSGNAAARAAFDASGFASQASSALRAAANGTASAADIDAAVQRLALAASTQQRVPSVNTTVVSIRGSLQGFDWSQDLYTWGTPLLMQALQRAIPFLAPLRLTRGDEDLLGTLSGIEEGAFSEFEENPRAFYVPITRVATALQRATRSADPMPLRDALQSVNADADDIAAYNMSAPLGSSLVLTGHSLGGGVAMIAGASADVAAVSYSGPGPVLGRERYQRSIDAACPECDADLSSATLQRHAFNIVPSGDIVPWAGGQSTRAVDIECTDGPGACHSVVRSMCTIMQSCGDQWGRAIVGFKQSAAELEVTPAAEQTMSDCCIAGQYRRGHTGCLQVLCAELAERPSLDTELRNLC